MKVRKRENAQSKDSRLLQGGREYIVYGISFKSSPQFLIYEPEELSFPFFVPSEAVDLVDARLSKFWSYSPALPSTEQFSSRAVLISFASIVSDRRFYQALVDGDRAAVLAWENAMQLIDNEANAG